MPEVVAKSGSNRAVTITYGGTFGTVPELLFEKDQLIADLHEWLIQSNNALKFESLWMYSSAEFDVPDESWISYLAGALAVRKRTVNFQPEFRKSHGE